MKFGISSGISLHCMTCGKKVDTLVVNGETIYPHRPDLKHLVFLQCETCGNYVSADPIRKTDTMKKWQKRHNKKVIPTEACRVMRRTIHDIIDPLWQNGIFERAYIYKRLSKATGKNYHNGSLEDEQTARKAHAEAMKLASEARALGFVPKRKESL